MLRRAGIDCILSFLFFLVTSAVSKSITVDDAGPDPVTGEYITFSQKWSYGPSCPGCEITAHANFDLSQVYGGTWHDSTTFTQPTDVQSATFTFTGTAIYVYGILPNNTGPWLRNVDLSFTLDGKFISYYSRELPDRTNYNVQFFAKEGLSNSQHTILVQNGADPNTVGSVALFDYLVYTQEDILPRPQDPVPVVTPNPTPSSKSNSDSQRSSSPQPATNSPTLSSSTSSSSTFTEPATRNSLPQKDNSRDESTSPLPPANQTLPVAVASAPQSFTNTPTNVVVSSDRDGVSRPDHTGAIIGGVVGGVVGGLAVIVAALMFFLRRRRQNQRRDSITGSYPPEITAFPMNTSTLSILGKKSGGRKSRNFIDLTSVEPAPPAYHTLGSTVSITPSETTFPR